MSGSIVPLSDHPYDPLPIITRRRDTWSERQSAHLNTMILSKFDPITVKALTVMGSHKNPSKLKNFLTEEHSFNKGDISQEIGSGHMTNTKNIFGG